MLYDYSNDKVPCMLPSATSISFSLIEIPRLYLKTTFNHSIVSNNS